MLCGWTASRTRPTSKIVTRISTGALIAPYALLGSDYDAFLSDVYTSVCTKDLLFKRVLLGGIFFDAMADTEPPGKFLKKCVDQTFLHRVATKSAKGRIFINGTANYGHPATLHLAHGRNRPQQPLKGLRTIPQSPHRLRFHPRHIPADNR